MTAITRLIASVALATPQVIICRERTPMKIFTLFLLLFLCVLPLCAAPPLIVTGWDSPTPAQFRRHLAEFETLGLFEGTTIAPTRRLSDGAVVSAKNAFSREPWQWKEFAAALADLQASKPTTCRETFLMLYSNPGDVDWFDDAAWREVVNHWRLLARLAKQGGLRGLLYDAEPYTKPHSQFRYGAQAGREKHDFAAYRAKARARGGEVMRAVAEEFPEVQIFCYRLFSDMLPMLNSGDLTRALEADTYGLQPSFVDGWMDALPPGLTIIEGTEDIGYRANSPAEYDAAFTRQRLRLPEFVAPEHRQKFAQHLRIGQSLYLDAHINPPGNPWHINSAGSTPAARLAANLASALAASDGIVWLYGEQARWWPGGNSKIKMWPEKFPGIVQAVRRAKDPAAFARRVFAAKTPRANLLRNGDFAKAQAKGEAPDGWFAWQDDHSHGVIACADGRVTISSASEAVVGIVAETKPGTLLAARLRVKPAGRGQGGLTIGWKTSDGHWTAHAHNAKFFPSGPADADGWREITGLIEVPSGAGHIVFMASAAAQFTASDRCEFDDAELVIVPADVEEK